MSKNKIGLVLTFGIILVFGGCVFSDGKKTEISFEEKKTENGTKADNLSAEKDINQNEAGGDPLEDKASEKVPVKEEKIGEKSDESNSLKPSVPVFKIADRLVSWGYSSSSGRKIDTIVVHSSYNSLGGDEHSLEKVLNIYKSYGVLPHYIIDREGKVYRLVADKNIAYHAGISKVPDGREDVNNFSIGIEIINTKAESPNSAQYASLKKLIAYLKDEYKIKYMLAHSDIAPGRKDDPWNFDWRKVK